LPLAAIQQAIELLMSGDIEHCIDNYTKGLIIDTRSSQVECNGYHTEQERLEALAGYRDQADDVDFATMCYDLGWVEPFDWVEWKETQEAVQLADDPEVLAKATSEQLQKLLTVMIRQDRFVEGSLASHFNSGFIDRIIDRVAVLAKGSGADT
jgi:hypothetical protein